MKIIKSILLPAVVGFIFYSCAQKKSSPSDTVNINFKVYSLGSNFMLSAPPDARANALSRGQANTQEITALSDLHAMATVYQWQSVTPTSIKIPISRIGLIKQDDSQVELYTCSGSTEADCSIDLAAGDYSNPVISQILSGVSNIPSGTYKSIYINTCVGSTSGYSASFTAEAKIDSVRYITTSSGVIANTTSAPSSMSVSYSGCQRTYPLPMPVTMSAAESKTFQIYFDPKNIAWLTNGNATTQNAWIPSGCSGSAITASSAPFGCMAYPDLAGVLDTAPPTSETYRINTSALLQLFVDSSGNIIGGFTRRYYQQGLNFNPGFTADTPLKTFSKNPGGDYLIENFGSTPTGHGYFKALNFIRANHSANFEDISSTPTAYTAVKVAGAPIDPTEGMVSCDSLGNKPFTQLPFDSLSKIRNIEPLGFVGPPNHTYPTDHAYFWFNKASDSELINVYAPGNIRVYSIESTEFVVSNFRQGQTDYTIRFLACKEMDHVLGHINSLQGPLASFMGSPDEANCSEYDTAPGTASNEHVKRCKVEKILDVTATTAGSPTLIAKASGSTAQQLDWGAFDSRVNNSFVNSSRVYQSMVKAICPLLFLDSSIQSSLVSKLGIYISASYGVAPSTYNPACGTTSVDVANTAQGIWVQNTAPASGYATEANQITLAPHYVRPDRETFGIGDVLPGVSYGSYYYTANHSSFINRSLSELVAGITYCYETNGSADSLVSVPSSIGKRFYLRLDNANQITIEGAGNLACGSGPWTFSSNARQFKR